MRTSFISDIKEQERIISDCNFCFVGMTEKDGSPYVIPMNFGYTDNIIILHSALEGRHIDILEHNKRVCITFCPGGVLDYQHPDVACSYSMTSKSVLCKGEVEFIEDMEEKELLLMLMMKKYTDRDFKFSEPAVRNVKVWKVEVKEMTAKAFGQGFKPKKVIG
jgi:uncharacterized protein